MKPSHLPVLRLLVLLGCLLALCPDTRAEKPQPFVVMPNRASGKVPVAVWLHGYRGYRPEGYYAGATPESMKAHADAMEAAIVSLPATTDLGDETQQWSEEPVADHAYLQARLAELAERYPLDLNRVALFGFSQGALVAAELATIYPQRYLGAVLMSAGGITVPKVIPKGSEAHRRQVYFYF